MKKHKILIIHLSIYQNFLLAKGLSELGHTAGVYYIDNPKNDFLLDHWENFNHANNSLYNVYKVKNRRFKMHALEAVMRFIYFLMKYDTFIYMAPVEIVHGRILTWGKEIAILKFFKKNILVTCSGAADIGIPLIGEPAYKLGNEEVKKKKRETIDKFDLKTMGYGPILNALQKGCKKSPDRHNFWFFNLINFNEWSKIKKIPPQFAIKKKKGYTYVYHSFGNSETRDNVKGTVEIIRAIENLKRKGHKIELMFFDKVPNKQLKYYQAQADIVIDQLKDGWHGQSGAECMALGKPIIVFYPPEILKLHPSPHEVPFINATVDTIETVLEDAVNSPEKMQQIGEKTKNYCKKYHDYRKQCERILHHIFSQ